MKRLTMLGIAAVLLAGCSEPRFDGTDEASVKASSEKIAAKLDPEDRVRFQSALQTIVFADVDLGKIMSGEQTGESLVSGVYAAIDGKTADEIILKADQIKAEREARERAQALAEIKELLDKEASAEAAKVELAKFVVERSRFYQRKSDYSFRPEPIIELVINNGTDHAVSRAYFKGTIASPGRAVPWLVESFNYAISGGLEPGETADLSLAPNSYSEWGSVRAPEDAVFTVEVIKLDGADGESLFDASGLTEREKVRLQKLQEQFK